MTKQFLFTLFGTICFAFCEGQSSRHQNARVAEKHRDIRLPKTDDNAMAVKDYIELVPDSDYFHAPEKAYEDFRDIKYGIRIHWGIYSMLKMNRESWGFLQLGNEEKQKYQELYKQFNPVNFDAEKWMELFDEAGIKCMAFTTKHHEGFSMFDTKTRVKRRAHYYPDGHSVLEDCNLSYSVMETPFKRDIVGELCTAARKHNIKIDLYFSHPDWYDADFRPMVFHPVQTLDSKKRPYERYGNAYNFLESHSNFIAPEPSVEETKRMIARHREQLTELLTNYGKIDMLCLDMWLSVPAWPQLKETIKILRQLQPDVMLRARGIGNYGDYYTPEGFVPEDKENTQMPWMTIHKLGTSFSYDSVAANYKGSKWIIDNVADAAAKGGSFMVGVGPDGMGNFHPEAVKQLKEAGKWLKVNGEAIYATRACETWHQGDSIRFTRSKDSAVIYAIAIKWPGVNLTIPSLAKADIDQVSFIEPAVPLKWSQKNNELVINIPDALQIQPAGQQLAWVIKIRLNTKLYAK